MGRKNCITRIIAVLVLCLMPMTAMAANMGTAKVAQKPKSYNISMGTIEKIVMVDSKYAADEKTKHNKLEQKKKEAEKKLARIQRNMNSPYAWDMIIELQEIIEDLDFKLKVNNITTDAFLKSQVIVAKQEYIKCLSLESNLKSMGQKNAYNKRIKNIAYAKYKKGLISLREYKEIETANEDYNDEIGKLNYEFSKQKNTLKTALGLDKKAQIKIISVKAPGLSQLPKIEPEKDAARAAEKSLSMKLIDEKLNKVRNTYPIDDDAIKELEKEKTQTVEGLKENFESIKENISLIEKEILKNKKLWNRAESEVNIAYAKLKKGLISKSKFEEIKQKNLDIMISANTIKFEIWGNSLKYEAIKNGYIGGNGLNENEQ